jgi:PleD family two-component response regulator
MTTAPTFSSTVTPIPLPVKNDEERFRILVIEDELSIARLLMANLTKVGMECRHAPDGEAALHSFAQQQPHLVLLDLMIPRLNGFAVCTRLRRESAVPIIVVSGRDEVENQVHSFQLGADDYIAKPFDISVLMARVVAQLRRVYRYGQESRATSKATPPPSQGLPVGWAKCDSCEYIGPGAVFQKENAQGRNSLCCPHCRSTSHVAFGLS